MTDRDRKTCDCRPADLATADPDTMSSECVRALQERLEAAECTDECVAVAEYDRVLEENERLQTQVATLKAADHDEIERLRAEGDERETEGFRNGWQTQQARIEAALADAKYAASRIGGSSAYAEVDRALQRMVKALKGEGERKQHPAADDMGRVHSVYDLGEGE